MRFIAISHALSPGTWTPAFHPIHTIDVPNNPAQHSFCILGMHGLDTQALNLSTTSKVVFPYPRQMIPEGKGKDPRLFPDTRAARSRDWEEFQRCGMSDLSKCVRFWVLKRVNEQIVATSSRSSHWHLGCRNVRFSCKLRCGRSTFRVKWLCKSQRAP